MSCFHKFFVGAAGVVRGGFISRKTARPLGRIAASAVLAAAALALNCGDKPAVPVGPNDAAYGAVAINWRVNDPAPGLGLAKTAAVSETKPAKIVIKISGAGFDTITVERAVSSTGSSTIDTVPKIPAGAARRISIYAADKNGATTHVDSLETRTVNVAANVVTTVRATLIPAAGSIYLLLNGLPAAIDSIWASFKRADGTVIAESRVKKSTRNNICLDAIPHLATGTLRVDLADASGCQLYSAVQTLTFNARGDNNITLQFTTAEGSAGISVDLRAPGVTIAAYDFSNPAATEYGELVITEIMYKADNNNYIELYNPSNTALYIDTLITDVDGTTCKFTQISIASKAFFVIGRQNMDNADIWPSSPYSFPLGAGSNWISVKRKNGAVIDRVVLAGADAALGWPSMPPSAYKSIELSADKYSAAENNYAKNWRVTTAGMFNTILSFYGTPRTGADF